MPGGRRIDSTMGFTALDGLPSDQPALADLEARHLSRGHKLVEPSAAHTDDPRSFFWAEGFCH